MLYRFTFYFNDIPSDLAIVTSEGWGANIGTAFNRAWKNLKNRPEYHDMKRLRPTSIGISYPEPVKRIKWRYQKAVPTNIQS